jgi:uncharacterized protein (TIGR03437 family)
MVLLTRVFGRMLALCAVLTWFVVGAAAAPSVSSISPTSAAPGGPAFTITVNGNGFVAGSLVQWNGATLATTFVNSSQVTGQVEAFRIAASGTATVAVWNPDVTASNALNFTIGSAAPLSITSISPNSAAPGGPAFTITVSGNGFVVGSVVQWDDAALSTTFVNSSQLTAQVEATRIAAPGVAFVTARNPDATVSNSRTFTVTTPVGPTASSLEPASVNAGGGTPRPITVNGNGFVMGSVVLWNGTALTTTYLNGLQVIAQLPPSLMATACSASITVRNPSGLVSNALTFTVTAQPFASWLTPSSVVAGSGDFTLTVSGYGFLPGSVVQWNGAALSTTFGWESQLTALVSASRVAAAGTTTVTVLNPGAPVSTGLTFTITASGAPPVLYSLDGGGSGSAGGPGFTLTVIGVGFVSGSVVQWDGQNLPTTFISSTQVNAQVPASAIATACNVTVRVANPGGVVSNGLIRSVGAVVISFSPSSVPAGSGDFIVTVNGRGFPTSAILTWNSNPLATTFVSSTQLTALVPAALIVAPGRVTVGVFNLGTENLGASFTVAAPSLSSLTPATVPAGSAGLTLTIDGANFIPTSQVSCACVGTDGLRSSLNLPTTFVSSSRLTAQVPAPALVQPGSAGISVLNGRAPSNDLNLAVTTPAPVLASLSPATAPAGSAAFTLTINGSGFFPACLVVWNGVYLAATFISSTQLTAQVPASALVAPVTATVSVLVTGAPPSNSLSFTVTGASTPAVASLSPATAVAGAGAFPLTIRGSGFVAGSLALWNGATLSTTFVNSSQVTAQVEAFRIAAPGPATVAIRNPDGTNSNALTFTVSSPAPVVSSLNPAAATAGGPAFTLTVNGSGFLTGATVLWNNSPLTTNYVNANLLNVAIPANLIASQGSASVMVTNPGGSASTSVTFTIGAPSPSISSLSPRSATAGGPSFTLTVSGSGFLPGSVVQWNGSPLSTGFVSSNQCTASVPANLIASQAMVSVTVLAPGGVTSAPASFTINPPTPVIASLSPNSATAGGSEFILTVNGSGFLVGSTVEWNGAPLSTSYVTGTQLTASVARALIASAGSAKMIVVNPNGATSGSATFLINPPAPVISELSPNSAVVGGTGFTLTVNGSGFLDGSVVQWNGSGLATSYVNGSQLTASVPAGLITNQGAASVRVLNPGGAVSNAAAFTVATAGLSITSASSLPAGTAGVPYSQVLAAEGGVTPYEGWNLVLGDLPPGLSVSMPGGGQTGLLDGVPTAPGVFNFIVQVTDSAKMTATRQFSLTINGGPVSISATGIVNAASYAGGSVSPGEIVTIFGSGLGPDAITGPELDSRGYLATMLAGTQVLFDGVAAPIVYTQAGCVSAVVPYEVDRKSSTQVQVVYQRHISNVVSIAVSTTMPGIFTANASGRGQGSIINADGTVNSADNPAPVGSYVSVYATGEGQTTPSGVDGKLGDWPVPLPVAQPVTATVGGLPAQVQYAGGASGLVAGGLQVNVFIPQGVVAGDSVPIVLTIGGHDTQAGVTLAIH